LTRIAGLPWVWRHKSPTTPTGLHQLALPSDSACFNPFRIQHKDAVMPFDFVDFDVKLANKPQKFYRVRQS
jgi:hypothetical protein